MMLEKQQVVDTICALISQQDSCYGRVSRWIILGTYLVSELTLLHQPTACFSALDMEASMLSTGIPVKLSGNMLLQLLANTKAHTSMRMEQQSTHGMQAVGLQMENSTPITLNTH